MLSNRIKKPENITKNVHWRQAIKKMHLLTIELRYKEQNSKPRPKSMKLTEYPTNSKKKKSAKNLNPMNTQILLFVMGLQWWSRWQREGTQRNQKRAKWECPKGKQPQCPRERGQRPELVNPERRWGGCWGEPTAMWEGTTGSASLPLILRSARCLHGPPSWLVYWG